MRSEAFGKLAGMTFRTQIACDPMGGVTYETDAPALEQAMAELRAAAEGGLIEADWWIMAGLNQWCEFLVWDANGNYVGEFRIERPAPVAT